MGTAHHAGPFALIRAALKPLQLRRFDGLLYYGGLKAARYIRLRLLFCFDFSQSCRAQRVVS